MAGPDVPSLAAAVEIIDRPGVNGIASRVDALKAEEITKETVEGVTNLATANAAADDYAALKGVCATVVDDLGRTTYYVLVTDVRVTGKRHIVKSDPANINYLIYAVWTLKPTL